MTATLLPNAKQQFISGNGIPLAGGKVYFYVPNTSTLKNTWQDSGESILNVNPIILDASGEAIIYGTGGYRQVVYDNLGNLIWDALTQDVTQAIQSSVALFCGTSTGIANAQILTPSPAVTSITTGQQFSFFAGFTNTNAMMITISALTYSLYYAGSALSGNSIIAGGAILIQFDGTNMELVNPYQLPIPGASGDILQSDGTHWVSAAPLLPAPGTLANVLTSTGTAWISQSPPPNFNVIAQQIFTSSGTYTPTTGMFYCVAEVIGGGGGGGNGSGTNEFGSGGGGGAYGRSILSSSTIGSSQAVTIGVAGAAGSNGGASSLGTLIVCPGGVGGLGSSGGNIGGSGGIPTTATIKINGGYGGNNIIGSSEPSSNSGSGGNSQYGVGGQAIQGANNGNIGLGFGSGGSGGGGNTGIGGEGTKGIVIITEYCAQ